ncbi:magnesium transporter [Ferrimonas balearica DSM 9799]|uniref:Magnesium transporter MgtE n=1 Tax=Ferrimonas balearica (strain DSM 9799 / CCM 4581 / KCTC 23876 / PAT) TaxID=550540 RepID=E1SLJ5_FERBD|nr:magnesium transporter [Ferrimonas balearica]MBY6019007.1 magnesium transporter [Halomonas denitrificans]ADN77546.1 magnesium transporter [Ferrimonas balearica DSM 9799]MBY5981619.1 magnesium transporter [Ferrimonas balearica]MBY6095609.1 magnesium transporter [Ferrimonas balearica]MBY6107887.1 magnesium transporter [Ferrimonas balearica]
MQKDTLFATLSEALAAHDKRAVRAQLEQMHVADFAAAVGDFNAGLAAQLLDLLSLPDHAEVFGYLDPQLQADIACRMPRNELAALFSQMESDERADLYNRLSEDQQQTLLPGLAQAEREDVRRLASYPEKTAGAMMSSDYATLRSHWTVRKALQRLRLEAPDKETIYQTYVIDGDRHLVGTISLRELILSNPEALIADIMLTEVVAVRVDEDQEDVSEKIRHYDLLALPVLDSAERLVGIVTYDDAMDAVVEEATEDAQKIASVAALEAPMNQVSSWELYRKRVGWLVLLVFGALLSGAGIAHFEAIIESNVALVFFMPLLVGSGGNAGSQSAALMVRALATGEVDLKDWAKVLAREVFVAGALGLTMAAAVFGLGMFRGGMEIAIVVASAMVCVVLAGSLIGLSLPFILSRVKMDPATASGPLVTTIVDATGVLIYLGFASMMLDLAV